MAATAVSSSIQRWGGQGAVEYLGVRVGHQEFALQLARVREIMFLQDLVSVPGMPSYVKGIITVYSTVVPVLDLRVRLGLPERDRTHRTCIVVVRVESAEVGGGRLVGLIVDAVSEIVQTAPISRRNIPAKCRRKRVKTLLDVDALLQVN